MDTKEIIEPQLEITLGEEYKIKIENSGDFNTSIFNQIYNKASENINAVIRQAKVNRELEKRTDSLNNEEYNNIVAFVGERGSGKSSSMISFAEALSNSTTSDFFSKFKGISESKFLALKMIDPSQFSEHDTLLEIIISKMFLRFQNEADTQDQNADIESKRKLVTLFQKVFDNLKTINNEKKIIYEHEVLDALTRLASGSNLRENLCRLIDLYLHYFKVNDGYLIIIIDDFDLNIRGSYSMLEDIRKYLIQNNIIILMACKIEQLQHSVKQEIIREYDPLIKYNSIFKDELNEIDNKSIKYLEKLIPVGRRRFMPELIINDLYI